MELEERVATELAPIIDALLEKYPVSTEKAVTCFIRSRMEEGKPYSQSCLESNFYQAIESYTCMECYGEEKWTVLRENERLFYEFSEALAECAINFIERAAMDCCKSYKERKAKASNL